MMEDSQSKRLLTIRQAAEFLNIKLSQMYKLRHFGGGPDWVRIGSAPRYEPQALEEYIAANRVQTDV